MKFLNEGNSFFIMRDIVRLFFVINFFMFMIILGLNTEIESEYVVLLSSIIAGPFFAAGHVRLAGSVISWLNLEHIYFRPSNFCFSGPWISNCVIFGMFSWFFSCTYLLFLKLIILANILKCICSRFLQKFFWLPSISLWYLFQCLFRFFCKYMCWQKVVYNIFCRVVGTTKIKRDVASCVNCKKCEKACPMNLPISSSKTLSGVDCFSCFSCMKPNVCPKSHKSLTFCWLGNVVNIRYFSVAALLVYLITTLIVLRYWGHNLYDRGITCKNYYRQHFLPAQKLVSFCFGFPMMWLKSPMKNWIKRTYP